MSLPPAAGPQPPHVNAGWHAPNPAGGPQPPLPAGGWQQPVPPQPGPVGLPLEARPSLPIVDTDYVQFFRSPRYRWWKSLLGIGMGGLLWLLGTAVFSVVGIVLDAGATQIEADGTVTIGPWFFLANNASIAIGIPAVMLTARVVFGQQPRWLSSVAGGLRWRWMVRCGLIILPIWLVITGVSYALAPPEGLQWQSTTWLMLVGILLTTPLQAAGEEYVIRGFLLRSVGAWIKPETVAFAVSGLVSSVVFMLLHGAGDPWLNVFYFTFGASAAWLTWRTGGLEAAIVLHVINNLLGEALLPFTDFSGIFNREAGAGDASVLIPMVAVVGVTWILDFWARRTGLVVRSAPGRATLEANLARYRALTMPPAGWVAPPPGWQAPRPE